MALTESNEFSIGTPAPQFKLLDTTSNQFKSLKELRGENGTVIFFICNHCPFVININEGLVNLANDYLSRGISFIAISSNDVAQYPQDGPEEMKKKAKALHYPFPYLYDESQEIAKAYDAACTPDFYIFDQDLKSVYHGQLDDSRPNNGIPVSGKDIRSALDLLLNQEAEKITQQPSIGCNIKWK